MISCATIASELSKYHVIPNVVLSYIKRRVFYLKILIKYMF